MWSRRTISASWDYCRTIQPLQNIRQSRDWEDASVMLHLWSAGSRGYKSWPHNAVGWLFSPTNLETSNLYSFLIQMCFSFQTFYLISNSSGDTDSRTQQLTVFPEFFWFIISPLVSADKRRHWGRGCWRGDAPSEPRCGVLAAVIVAGELPPRRVDLVSRTASGTRGRAGRQRAQAEQLNAATLHSAIHAGGVRIVSNMLFCIPLKSIYHVIVQI